MEAVQVDGRKEMGSDFTLKKTQTVKESNSKQERQELRRYFLGISREQSVAQMTFLVHLISDFPPSPAQLIQILNNLRTTPYWKVSHSTSNQ